MFEVPGFVNGLVYKGAQEKNCIIKVKDRKNFSVLRFRIDENAFSSLDLPVMSCDISCRI
jgi:hypothetical protein